MGGREGGKLFGEPRAYFGQGRGRRDDPSAAHDLFEKRLSPVWDWLTCQGYRVPEEATFVVPRPVDLLPAGKGCLACAELEQRPAVVFDQLVRAVRPRGVRRYADLRPDAEAVYRRPSAWTSDSTSSSSRPPLTKISTSRRSASLSRSLARAARSAKSPLSMRMARSACPASFISPATAIAVLTPCKVS